MFKFIAHTQGWRLILFPLESTVSKRDVIGGSVTVESDGVITIHTGTMYGPVDVAIEMYEQPPSGSIDDWDDVVEVSARATDTGPVGLVGMFSEGEDSDGEDPDAVTVRLGVCYRIRVHVRGRDETGSDDLIEMDQPAKDHVFLQLWPADWLDPKVWRVTSAKAQQDDEQSRDIREDRAVTLNRIHREVTDLKAFDLWESDL